MKSLFTFVSGLVVGAALLFALQNPKEAASNARVATDMVEAKVNETRRERCIRQYLDSTSCYQKLPAKECDAAIVERCGLPE